MQTANDGSSKLTQRVAWAGFALLLGLHLDFWRPRRAEIWFGWMPEELVWRVAWMGLAFAYLCWFCQRVWKAD